jgi:hypothetical protein
MEADLSESSMVSGAYKLEMPFPSVVCIQAFKERYAAAVFDLQPFTRLTWDG